MCPFHNNQRDGYGRQTINTGQVSYHNNSLANNTPETSSAEEGGYVHYQEKVDGRKIQARSESFKDHFSQAILFWNSMTDAEKDHIIQAFSFELGKVSNQSVQQQVVDMFANVNLAMAQEVAGNIGVEQPQQAFEIANEITKTSPALSQENTRKNQTREKLLSFLEMGLMKKM